MNDVAAFPYRQGSLSRFLAWSRSLPLAGWWLYALLVVTLFGWSHLVLWLSGDLPPGTIDEPIAASALYGPYILGALAYIDRVAVRALANFWPATGWPDEEHAQWAYRFETMPAGQALPCLIVGLAIGLGAIVSTPASLFGGVEDRLAFFVSFAPVALFGYGLLPFAIVQTVRQLRLVARIHREARAIDPFDRVPVYAFSRLTVQTGLAFILIGYYTLSVNSTFQEGNLVALAALGSVILLGVACFIVPLWGIHERLVHEKEVLLAGVEARAGALAMELYRRIDAGEFEATKVVSEAIAGVGAVRERVARLPTWPWPPQLFRGFLSALLLPVVVYLMSRLIGGRIGL